MCALEVRKTSRHAPLVPFDTSPQLQGERASIRGEPQAVGPPIRAPATLDKIALLKRINHADHRRALEVHRLGAFPDRSLDIDVVFDLMIHDLDIILALVKAEPVSIEAVGVAVLTDKYDIANARLRFASGCIANVTASRISKERVRKIRFFQPDAYVSIDYAEQEVEGYRLVRREGERPQIQGGKLPVTREEPLKRELADFVRAVAQRRRPLVGGEDGLRALKLAQAIADKMESV